MGLWVFACCVSAARGHHYPTELAAPDCLDACHLAEVDIRKLLRGWMSKKMRHLLGCLQRH